LAGDCDALAESVFCASKLGVTKYYKGKLACFMAYGKIFMELSGAHVAAVGSL